MTTTSEHVHSDIQLSISFRLLSHQSPVADEIARTHDLLLAFHEEVERSLSWNPLKRVNSLVASFDFPEEIKVPCKQYLQYFVQFLRDLGVEADSELKHEAGHVLFSITPTDKTEALDRIREALRVYVLLPESPIGDNSFDGESIEYQRLAANVLHLKSQLQLARALCNAQETTIKAQQFALNQQQRMLNGTVVEASLVKVEPASSSDTENLFGGRLTLGKYETKGVGIDWALLFRDLKQLFKRRRP